MVSIFIRYFLFFLNQKRHAAAAESPHFSEVI